MTSAQNLPKTASGLSRGAPHPHPQLNFIPNWGPKGRKSLSAPPPHPPLIWRSGLSATDSNTQRIFVTYANVTPLVFLQKSVLNKWIIESNWICTFFPFQQECELKSVVYIVISLTVAGIWQFFLLYMVILYSLISFTSTMYFCSFHNLFQSNFPAKSGFDEYKWQSYYYPFHWWLAVVLWLSVFSVVWSIVCNRWCAQLFFFSLKWGGCVITPNSAALATRWSATNFWKRVLCCFFFVSRICSGRIFRGQEIQTVSR